MVSLDLVLSDVAAWLKAVPGVDIVDRNVLDGDPILEYTQKSLRTKLYRSNLRRKLV